MIYSILKYMKHRRYVLFFKETKENLETVEFIKEILHQFSPPIHVPLIFRLMYNSLEVLHNDSGSFLRRI